MHQRCGVGVMGKTWTSREGEGGFCGEGEVRGVFHCIICLVFHSALKLAKTYFLIPDFAIFINS